MSFLGTSLKIYMPDVMFGFPVDMIKAKSDDFLGIREATFSIIPWQYQIEIGAALALRKKVYTVFDPTKIHFVHPMLKSFATWQALEQYLYKTYF